MNREGFLVLAFIALFALVIAGCGDSAVESVSDDGSEEACEYKVSQDLDDGEYDEVLESDCASHMDRAAAHVGLAGFEANRVIEDFIDANDVEDDDTVDLYMKALVGRVSTSSLGNLYSARSEYSQVSTGDDNFENAQFNNVVIVNSLIVLSNIKGVLDPEGDGISDCDINSNDTPDEADAAACALLVVGGESCSQIDANEGTPTSGLSFEGFTNTYNGYQVLITDNGGPDEGGACPSTYKKLLNSTDTSVVATTSDQCVDVSGNGTWPCPFEDGGNSVDIVSAFQDAVVTSSDFLDEMIEDVDNEISEAVDELLVEVCGADEQCTSIDMAQYLDELD